MLLTAGTILGPYEITALLGKGGMGEVYRARDTKLKRDVAIKILPAEFSRDAERLARFQREAETLAALNHQNIAAIYDLAEADGKRFLVLELVEGQTLDEMIVNRGAMRFNDAFGIATQICEALEAAHERGIVHRDLKPANIKVTPAGKVKILDFGLAKAFQEPHQVTPSDSPTLMSASVPGLILGTPGYMSPEQVRGEPVDKRADVWAFGVVLWEMVTGKRLYQGKTVSDVLAAVIREEPDLSKVPGIVRPLLRRCLQKETHRRLRDIGDAMAMIEDTVEIEPGSSRSVWVLAAIAALSLIACGVLLFIHFRKPSPALQVLATSIEPPENTNFDFAAGLNSPSLSPDGRRIVFAAGRDGKTQLWMRPLESTLAQSLAGTDNAQFPFWSPDSRSIGFFADSKLKRIDAAGGPVLTVAEAPSPRGGAWGADGIIVFAPNVGGQLQRVAASGGTPTTATTFDPQHDYSHSFPWFLPDGRHFIFEDQTQAGIGEVTLRVGSLDSKEIKTVGTAHSNAAYSSGYLLYLRENTLMAQPFDEKNLNVNGAPRPIAEQVRSELTPNYIAFFTVSRDGLLAYQSGPAAGQQLTWFDRNGKRIGTLGQVNDFFSLAISPDGKRVATTRLDENNDIWIYDVTAGFGARFTLTREAERDATWSPDGKNIVYRSNAKGPFDLYRKAADGTGKEELLYADAAPKVASGWAPDGRNLLFFRIDPKTQRDIWLLPGADAIPSKPVPWLVTPFNEAFAKFSPDGHWVTYASDESGRYEVYVAPFPGPGGKRQLSTGGTHPRWRGDGKEIFYVGSNGMVMAATVLIRDTTIDVGEIRSLGIPVFRPSMYDVTADGQRFLVATPDEQKSAPLTLVQDWTALLKK